MRGFKKFWLPVLIILVVVVFISVFYRTARHKKPSSTDKPQLVLELGHAGLINSVAFSPDGGLLATGGQDNTVNLWDVASGTGIRTLKGHTSTVASVVFSPDGKQLFTGSYDRTIKFWEVATGTELRTLNGHTDMVYSIALSPDGKWLASGSRDKTIKVWDVAAGTEIYTLEGHRLPVTSVAFNGDGWELASGSEDGSIKLWSLGFGLGKCRRTLQGHTFGVLSVAFSPDGTLLASGSKRDIKLELASAPNLTDEEKNRTADDTLKLWDAATGAEIHTLKGDFSVYSVAFSPDGKTLVSDTNRAIKLWDAATGTEIRTLGDQDTSLTLKGLSPDGRMMASVRDFHTIDLWDVEAGRVLRTLKRRTAAVPFVAFSAHGKILAGIGRGIANLWDTTTGAQLLSFKANTETIPIPSIDRASEVSFSADGKLLARIGLFDIGLWDVSVGKKIHTLRGHTEPFKSVAFSPDGKTLASGNDGGTIKLWDVLTGTELHTLEGGPDKINSVAFSPDGKTLASANCGDVLASTESGDQVSTIKLWDTTRGTELRTLRAPCDSIIFSPDGEMLASRGSDINLWNVTSDTKFCTLNTNTTIGETVAFSPDGKMLASGTESSVDLWDIAACAKLRTLKGHNDDVASITFSPDGKTLASGSSDDTIRLWDVETGVELASLVTFLDDSWVIVTPDGRFDTNRIDDIKGLHWLMPDAPLTPLPIEIFMRDYYEPRLMGRILTRERFKPVRDFSTLNRTQPEVKIVGITPDSAETFQVTLQVANVKSEVQRDAEGHLMESGVFDVRLFRDGQLVGYAPGDGGAVELDADDKANLTFSHIKWSRMRLLGQNVEFSAYAFNSDRIKSATVRATTDLESEHMPVKGRAYVISLGVNAYEREGLNLRYAATDARQVQESLVERLAAQGEYEEVVGVSLVSDYAMVLADGRTLAAQDATIKEVTEGQRRVTESRATKAHLRAVLDVLAGRQADAALLKETPNADKLRAARPEDLILISVSSHGYTDSDGIFYIVPSDTGTAAVSSPEFRKHCISSDELSLWLRDVDAGELVMIVDACHSSAAVEGTDFKPGPMGSRGLGQLSYDKGMRILTATQADNVAMETNRVRQGLLTYALLNDGLGAWRADSKPQDNQITLTEWLGYGVERVPHLYAEVNAGAMEVSDTEANLSGAARIIRDTIDPRESDNDKTQQPSLFDFARRRRELVLARKL